MQATILRALLWIIQFHLWQMKDREDLVLWKTGRALIGEIKSMVDDEERGTPSETSTRGVVVIYPLPLGAGSDQAG